MDDAQQQAIALALAQAKRVRRESSMLVQSLAQIRDSLENPTAVEAQGNGSSNSST